MLRSVKVHGLEKIPHLERSLLMSTHGGALTFATDRPNVIVGPNGAGKSALLHTLAVRFLAHLTGRSEFDRRYVIGHDCRWWSGNGGWRGDFSFLRGLECDTDNAPTLYYRPGLVPGDEPTVVHAMMTGYAEEARAYGRMVKDRSSGEGNRAVLASILAALAGEGLPQGYGRRGWSALELAADADARLYRGPMHEQAAALRRLVAPAPDARPLLLLDEPEQSLDALAAAQLWDAIAAADCSKVQVIVATHSLHPLLAPESFRLIEAQPGYAEQVLRAGGWRQEACAPARPRSR